MFEGRSPKLEKQHSQNCSFVCAASADRTRRWSFYYGPRELVLWEVVPGRWTQCPPRCLPGLSHLPAPHRVTDPIPNAPLLRQEKLAIIKSGVYKKVKNDQAPNLRVPQLQGREYNGVTMMLSVSNNLKKKLQVEETDVETAAAVEI